MAREVAERVLRSGLPPRTFLNVNVPRSTPQGIRVTVQGARNHSTTVTERRIKEDTAFQAMAERLERTIRGQ